MKKILLIFLGVIFSVGLFIPSLAYGQSLLDTNPTSVYKPEVVEKFEISLSLETNSDIRIKERIHYYFPNPKHGIYRNIPINKRSEGNRLKTPTSIKINSILYYPSNSPTSIGNSYSKEIILNDEVVLRIGDADRTITGLYIYEIDYTVKNGINYFEDHDELYWNIIGTGWTVPINSVVFPALKKPPVVDNLVTIKPCSVKFALTAELSSFETIAIINFMFLSSLNIKSYKHNIAILAKVFFSFNSYFTRFF